MDLPWSPRVSVSVVGQFIPAWYMKENNTISPPVTSSHPHPFLHSAETTLSMASWFAHPSSHRDTFPCRCRRCITCPHISSLTLFLGSEQPPQVRQRCTCTPEPLSIAFSGLDVASSILLRPSVEQLTSSLNTCTLFNKTSWNSLLLSILTHLPVPIPQL